MSFRWVLSLAGAALAAAQTPISITVTKPADTSQLPAVRTFLSTNFQAGMYSWDFFTGASGRGANLTAMNSQHIRIQPTPEATPNLSALTCKAAFGLLDQVVQPVLAAGDHSAVLQLIPPDPFDISGSARFMIAVAQYYDGTGITLPNRVPCKSPSAWPIRWFTILNEPDHITGNYSFPGNYLPVYQAVVPALHAAGDLVAAPETSYYNTAWIYPLLTDANPPDAISVHYYESNGTADADYNAMCQLETAAMDGQCQGNHKGELAATIQDFRARSNLPLWVDEANVNSDYGGTDYRGTSPFFAGWRPLMFSQMVKTNVPLSLHHWNYEVTNRVLGEVDGNNIPYLSYWVDRELSRLFSQSEGRVVLPTSNPDQAELEELAVLNGDGSVNIMVANHAVGNCPDSTGVACAGFKVSAAVTASGFSLAGAQMAILDSAHAAPQWAPFGSTLDFAAGYGVAFLTTTAPAPSLSVSETHAGNFVAGTTNTYTIGIQNTGTVATSGTVTVTDTLPTGLSATAMSGTRWSCPLGGLQCTRTDALAPGGSYEPITVTVNVAYTAGSTVANLATASGGGAASASDVDATTVLASCDVTQNGTNDAGDVQKVLGEVLGRSSPVDDLNNDGKLNVVDIELTMTAVLGKVCWAR